MEFQNGDVFRVTNTYRNLQSAFIGETSAGTKYRLFGEKAREEDYQQIGDIFDQTSHNELAHAEVWYKLLHGGEVPTTLENLKEAYGGENREWTGMYVSYADEARREGYPEIARLFEEVLAVERHHDAQYRKLAQNILNDNVFCKGGNTLWVCLNCGNLFYGECAPSPCPLCGYPQGFYELNCENF